MRSMGPSSVQADCLCMSLQEQGTTAYLLTDRFERMLVIATAVGVFSTVLGTYLSFHLDASTGGCIVCVLSLVFVGAYLFTSRQAIAARLAFS